MWSGRPSSPSPTFCWDRFEVASSLRAKSIGKMIRLVPSSLFEVSAPLGAMQSVSQIPMFVMHGVNVPNGAECLSFNDLNVREHSSLVNGCDGWSQLTLAVVQRSVEVCQVTIRYTCS